MLTRDELVMRIADKHPAWWIRDIFAAADVIFADLAGSLALGRRVDLRDFGSFSVRPLRARAGYCLGGVYTAPERARVQFKSGRLMGRRLNPGATGTAYASHGKVGLKRGWPLGKPRKAKSVSRAL
jgi:integration host factor subunit beta